MRDRELVETLKMKALPEGSCDYESLVEFLRLYRDAVQLVVNKLWSLDRIPSISSLHRMFYSELRKYGFRAHHVKQIYAYAKAVVKAVKRSGGRKLVLRRLTARIDKYDYRLDLESKVLVLKVHGNREVKLRLLTSSERVEKFKGWSNYEIAVKLLENKVYVAVYFRKSVKPRKPKTVMAIDMNFDNITLAIFAEDGRILKLKRFRTPLRKTLTRRIWIERIQKRYAKSWRFTKGIRKAIKRHGERIRSIAWDYAHKIGDRIGEIANKYNAVIVLENLSHLRENAWKSNSFNKRLSLWFYRRLQFTVEYEALERSLEVKRVSPKRTSSSCPRCGGKLKDNGSRVLYCTKCGFVGDRDVVACVNLFLRYSRCGVPGVTPNAPKPDETPSGMQGNQDEAMKEKPELNPPKGDANPRPMRGNKDEAMTSTYMNRYES